MSITVVTDLRRLFNAQEAELMKAGAAVLNSAVFEARRGIIEHSKRVLDRPRAWSTDRAYLVDKAKPGDGVNMKAILRVKPEQAQVLGFQIDGGDRRRGDVGATRYDVPVGAGEGYEDRDGGIKRGTVKKMAKASTAEKTKRQALAVRRAAVRASRAAATTADKRAKVAARLQAVKWVVKSKNVPGVFSGTIGGVRGYWERPGRSLAAATRRRGVQTVQPRGRNTPKLIVAFADVARYRRKPIKWADQMAKAQFRTMTTAAFGRELERLRNRPPTP